MGFFQDPAGATTAFFNDPGSATSGNIVPGLDNPFQSGKTVWLPGAGGLNPLNSQSAIGQLTKDVGQLNPFNPDSTAGKVVNNIGADMAKDPVKWVAIAACIAAGPAGWKMIPYVNAVAALTSKNSTPEEWLTEGAKAYVISAGGEYVANNVTGVGPQTDITTGETFAGTGATGAMGSAKAGAVAGNISRNIFATAARKGNTDINSAQIVTGALTNEALNEAFKTMPGFDGLTRDEQSATVSAFKVAFNKDSNAAYQLFNQGFDATIKGLNQAAGYAGYKDLNERNAVNNFVMAGGSKEDIDALAQREKSSEDLQSSYAPELEKYNTWNTKVAKYDEDLAKFKNIPFDWHYGELRAREYAKLMGQWNWMQDAANQPMAYNELYSLWENSDNAWKDVTTYTGNLKTLQEQGWDNLAQQKEAAVAGYTTPETYDTYLTDKKAAEEAETQRKADEESAAQTKAQEEAAAQAKAQADAQAAIDAETARAAQEAKEAEEQAKRVAEFGKDLPGGGVQDLGPVNTNTDFYDKDASGYGAYKYDEKSGTYTYTSDDGSTLTLDGDGNIVGSTESTDTPWTGITDSKTGNMNLPKLPSGKTPNVNVNTMKTPNPGLPALSPLVAAGMFGALTQNQGSGYNPAPVQAPNVTMDWNAQPVQAPENGIAYGQQFLNPTYSTGAAGGGLMSLAAGGMTGKFTTLGSYSDGGRLLRGPGDGMSDNIPATIANRQPARLADGEFVVPADVVSHLGNGSTDAGAKVLYAMMDRVRKARTGKAKQGKKIMPQKFVPN